MNPLPRAVASMALSPQATLATARGGGSSETGDRVASEDVLQRELNLPRVTRLAGDEAERRAVGVAIGPAPVRMVQNVESLDAELQLLLFGNGEVLAQTNVEIPDARVGQA